MEKFCEDLLLRHATTARQGERARVWLRLAINWEISSFRMQKLNEKCKERRNVQLPEPRMKMMMMMMTKKTRNGGDLSRDPCWKSRNCS